MAKLFRFAPVVFTAIGLGSFIVGFLNEDALAVTVGVYFLLRGHVSDLNQRLEKLEGDNDSDRA